MARGFDCESCCEPDIDLPAASLAAYRTRLELARDGDVSLFGCYCGLPTGGSMALLAAAGGTPTCVYVVPRRNDPRVELPAGCSLHLARREVGDLVLYALSQRPGEAALAQFVVPEQ